jgi:[ribosomal protein S5]-alanine N-acetyltransferase
MRWRDHTIITPRTVLQPFVEADEDELLVLFREPAVRRYLLDDEQVSAEWVRAETASSRARFDADGTGLWAIRVAGQHSIAGFAGFREFYDPPQLQLLYGLLPRFWGRGLATEAARAVCDYARRELGLTEIKASTDIANEASARVLLRLGMRKVRTTAVGAVGTAFYMTELSAPQPRRV